jgi:transcriptional regulator with XRE-family HTH domain
MPSRPRNIIGPQFRRIRYARGLSQPEFAATCQRMGWDISRDIVARIEGQTRWVADFELLLLAQALEIPTEQLLPASRDAKRALRAFLAQE